MSSVATAARDADTRGRAPSRSAMPDPGAHAAIPADAAAPFSLNPLPPAARAQGRHVWEEIYCAKTRFLERDIRSTSKGTQPPADSDVSEHLGLVLRDVPAGHSILIGRHASGPLGYNHVALSCIFVSRNHLSIMPTEHGSYVVRQLRKLPVEVLEKDGASWRPLSGAEELPPGARLRFSVYTATLPERRSSAPQVNEFERQLAELLASRPDGQAISIGRHSADLLCVNSYVSGLHARIHRNSPGHYVVTDANSTNGTFFLGSDNSWHRVPASGVILPAGSSLRLGPAGGAHFQLPGASLNAPFKRAVLPAIPISIRKVDQEGKSLIFTAESSVAWESPGTLSELQLASKSRLGEQPAQYTGDRGMVEVRGFTAEEKPRFNEALTLLAGIPDVRTIFVCDDLGTHLVGASAGQRIRAFGPSENGALLVSRHMLESALGQRGMQQAEDLAGEIIARAQRIKTLSAPQRREYTVLHVRKAARLGEDLEAQIHAPYGTYLGHPILGRDMSVLGAVLLPITYKDGRQRPGILVDPMDPVLDKLFETFRENAIEPNLYAGSIDPPTLLKLVLAFSKNTLRYDLDCDAKVIKRTGGNPEAVVSVSEFVALGRGVCEHLALLGGYLVDRTIKDGYCRGRTSIERNEFEARPGAEQGGHAWVRYEDPDRGAFALDPAQDYVGEVELADNWLYARPSDVEALRRRPF